MGSKAIYKLGYNQAFTFIGVMGGSTTAKEAISTNSTNDVFVTQLFYINMNTNNT